LGSLAIAHATVLSVRRKNPYTTSLKESRQWSVLLKDVRIGAMKIDHLWISGQRTIKELEALPPPYRIVLQSKVRSYWHKGDHKFTLVAPLRVISVSYAALSASIT